MTVMDGARARVAKRGLGGRLSWITLYVRQLAILDFCCALTAGVIGFTVRFGNDPVTPLPNVLLAIGLPLVWVPWLMVAGAFDARIFGTGSDEYRRIFNAGVSLTAAVALVSYATKAEIARGYVVAALPLLTILNLFARYRLRKHLHDMRAQGACMRRVVVVGHRDGVTDMVRELRRSPYHGLEVVAACLPGGVAGEVVSLERTSPSIAASAGERGAQVPVCGDLAGVTGAVEWSAADTVAVVSCPELDGVTLRRLAWELEKSGTELFVAPALLDVAGPRTTIRPIAGFPLLHVEHVEFAGPRRIVKAVVDKTVAGLALIALSPLIGLITLAIRVTDPGPAFFVQRRIGRDGQEFPMIKFRTMVMGAEHLKVELVSRNDSDAVLFKVKSDPRVTRLGAFLRRYSLDELPQLVNVLHGDMSLIGPRPPLREEVEQYGEDVYRRLVVKPGLTGLWQVSGRSDLPWEEAVRLDLQYVENWSLVLDMQILWKTLAAVAKGSGAY